MQSNKATFQVKENDGNTSKKFEHLCALRRGGTNTCRHFPMDSSPGPPGLGRFGTVLGPCRSLRRKAPGKQGAVEAAVAAGPRLLRQLSLGPRALPATHECTTSGAGESGPPPRPSRVAGQALEGAEHALVAVGAAGTVTVRRFGGARRLRRTPGADRAVTAGRRPYGTTPRL